MNPGGVSPWAVDAGCTPHCAAHAAPRVPVAESVRRCAALAYTIARGVSRGERLAEPDLLRGQARSILAALGIGLAASPVPLTVPGSGTGTLIVANHISWLDVVAVLAVEPVTLLAKREIGRWPVVGTLARRVGTRFIDRDGLRELPSAMADLASALRSGESVLVFPQATTWCDAPGGRFRRAAFQAAVDAGAAVRPVTIAYEQLGAPSTVAAFLGDEGFVTSLRRVAGASALTVRITSHPLLPLTDRRSLAAEARAAVAGAERGCLRRLSPPRPFPL
ncbi:1-acyl-sn-glycerol-3-phosphate acyltransferase [Streptomyces sp. ISL-96]|uniref:lysophospholipid acyltransferase family protein n=1 Tax=Streptomyces sp. ISL-96 TaxID=2819191 RepID=UPI001BEA11EA|nr:lysophospholipid acyltransferase family protein [Streptomyces sp. ISL-96]MBT2487645.1 1-acyl-sn-glycerol-3-phosphate acyltransferase [Streptomyces sp. ISL-96]